MKKLLILPSWYPCPDDKINGSFFREQANILSDHFDIRVLIVRFSGRPSVRAFLETPVETGLDWLRFVFQKKRTTVLPDSDVFINPPLIEYRSRVIQLTSRQRYKGCLDVYLNAIYDLISSGWKPDLMHAHSAYFGGVAAYHIKKAYAIPYVITEHAPFAISNYSKIMRNDVQLSFSKADKVLSLSRDKVRQLGMSGIDVECNLVYNLVNETFFEVVAKPYSPGEPLRLISIGAASHFKDHRTLLRAVEHLKCRQIPYSLTLIGLKAWGEMYDQTLELISELGLDKEVTVIDRIDRDEVSSHLVAHNVYVMSSIAEGFPVSVLEALASGLFVVATRHGGTEDVMSDEMGRIVNVKDHEKIASYLEDIYLGKIVFSPSKIREAIVSICGCEAFKRRLIGYYQQAMGNSR